jgi:hypothetical protein
LRERFDAGTGLVALGAVLLLVSLFVDWYDPSGTAWAVFEFVDIVLALAAIACLVAVVPRYAALQRAVPVIAFVALFIVAVQLIQPPPAAAGDQLKAGAWLALAATALMAAGATLSAASISVTVDVRQRDRRRRTSAIDAREREAEAEAEAAAAAAAAPDDDDADDLTGAEARRRRRAAAADDDDAPAADALWRGRRPIPDEPAPVENEPRRRRAAAADDDGEAGPAPHASDPPTAPEPGADPDRTQALDPIDAPREDGGA